MVFRKLTKIKNQTLLSIIAPTARAIIMKLKKKLDLKRITPSDCSISGNSGTVIMAAVFLVFISHEAVAQKKPPERWIFVAETKLSMEMKGQLQ